MGAIRDLVIAAPRLCGSADAERWSKVNELVYDYEKANAGSPFSKNANDATDPYNRCKVLFAFTDGDEKKKEQCKRLFRIAELSHYKNEDGDLSVNTELDALIVEGVYAESENAVIAEVLTVDEAVATGGW
jgi:hypothetical protein